MSPVSIAKKIYEDGGIKRFYSGIDSAITRQIFYTTARLGIYKSIFQYYKDKNHGHDPSLLEKAISAVVAGLIASFIGNPADLSLIRMQADCALPLAERRNYTNVINAFTRIAQEEGVTTLWRGSVTTMFRAVFLNLGMLAPYDEAKERLNEWRGEQNSNKLYASAIAGFFASFFSLPFDNAKTKMQKMKPNAEGVLPYKNILDALKKTVNSEGFVGLYSGFPTYYVRIAPHAMITLLIQDYLTDFVDNWRSHH